MFTRKQVRVGIVTLLASMGLVGSAAGQNNWLLTGGVGNNFGGKATIYSKSGIGTSNAVAEARVTRQDAKDGCENQNPPEPNLAACVKENLAAEAGHTYRATADCHAGRITLTDGNAYTFDGLWMSGDGAGRTKWRDASGQIVGPDIASGGLGISMSWEVLCPGPLRITPAGRSATAGGGARAPSRPAGNAPFTANHVIKFTTGTERQRALLKKIAVVRDMADGDFVTANEDLNDDGMREVIVMSRSAALCGSGGCTTVVLQQRPNGIAVIFSQLVFEPLAVTNEKIGTYHALAAADDNGGIIIGYKRGTPMFGKQLVYPMNGPIEAGRAAPPPGPLAAPVRAVSQNSPVCGNQPFCTEVSSFSATIADFRAILQNTNSKTLTVRISFRNKLNRPLILGYVSESAVATDDQNNRYSLSRQRAVQGMGQVSGNAVDSKFVLQPGESSDALFEFVWNSSGREIFGLTFQMNLAIREIEPLPGNQFRLGREDAIHFSGLNDRSASAVGSSRTAASAQPPASANAPISPVAASSEGDACSGRPRCYSAGPFMAEVIGMTPSQITVGMHMLQVNVRFRNLTNQPLILAYVAGSGIITDNAGKPYSENSPYSIGKLGARGMGTVDRDKADPQFVLSSGASSSASFVLVRGHGANDPRDPIGTTFAFDLSIAQLEVLPSQQVRTLRDYSVGFTGLGNSAVATGSSSRTAATTQPAVSGDAPVSPVAASSQVDPCNGKPRCYSAGPFMAEVIGMTPSQITVGIHMLQVNVRFRNLTNQPLILAYVAGSGIITDNAGKPYNENSPYSIGKLGARGMGTVDRDKADPQFVLSSGASSSASFVLVRGHSANDPRDPIGTTFTFDVSIAQLEVLPSQQITTLREYSMDFTNLTAGGVASAQPGDKRGKIGEQLKDLFKITIK
jgi:hypothetical protein